MGIFSSKQKKEEKERLLDKEIIENRYSSLREALEGELSIGSQDAKYTVIDFPEREVSILSEAGIIRYAKDSAFSATLSSLLYWSDLSDAQKSEVGDFAGDPTLTASLIQGISDTFPYAKELLNSALEDLTLETLAWVDENFSQYVTIRTELATEEVLSEAIAGWALSPAELEARVATLREGVVKLREELGISRYSDDNVLLDVKTLEYVGTAPEKRFVYGAASVNASLITAHSLSGGFLWEDVLKALKSLKEEGVVSLSTVGEPLPLPEAPQPEVAAPVVEELQEEVVPEVPALVAIPEHQDVVALPDLEPAVVAATQEEAFAADQEAQTHAEEENASDLPLLSSIDAIESDPIPPLLSPTLERDDEVAPTPPPFTMAEVAAPEEEAPVEELEEEVLAEVYDEEPPAEEQEEAEELPEEEPTEEEPAAQHFAFDHDDEDFAIVDDTENLVFERMMGLEDFTEDVTRVFEGNLLADVATGHALGNHEAEVAIEALEDQIIARQSDYKESVRDYEALRFDEQFSALTDADEHGYTPEESEAIRQERAEANSGFFELAELERKRNDLNNSRYSDLLALLDLLKTHRSPEAAALTQAIGHKLDGIDAVVNVAFHNPKDDAMVAVDPVLLADEAPAPAEEVTEVPKLVEVAAEPENFSSASVPLFYRIAREQGVDPDSLLSF